MSFELEGIMSKYKTNYWHVSVILIVVSASKCGSSI